MTVTYDMVATDTDYNFFTDSDDVKLDQEFDNNHGYVFTKNQITTKQKLYLNV